jgi:hypothetical protein
MPSYKEKISNGKPVYIIFFLKNSVSNLIRNKEKSDHEVRIETLENKVNMFLESENKDDKRSGPAEIQTRNPRSLKGFFVEYRYIISLNYIMPLKNNSLNLLNCNPINTDFPSNSLKESNCKSSMLNEIWIEHKISFEKWFHYKNISESTKKSYFSALSRFFERKSVSKPIEFRDISLKDKKKES